jgi:HD superfamily phosphodiesterase
MVFTAAIKCGKTKTRENMSERLSKIQKTVWEMIAAMPNDEGRTKFFVHSGGVSLICGLLAAKRGLDPELAAVMGLLHDIYAIAKGTYEAHDVLGANMAQEIMMAHGGFSECEISAVHSAILRHDALDDFSHGPYDELLKDADVLQPYYQNIQSMDSISPQRKARMEKLFTELGI